LSQIGSPADTTEPGVCIKDKSRIGDFRHSKKLVKVPQHCLPGFRVLHQNNCRKFQRFKSLLKKSPVSKPPSVKSGR
jgi:hypothetical protein